MRARASLLLAPELKPEWVSIRGQRTREMPVGSTESFSVDIQVPPGTWPGSHTFRLVVADVALPDERYTEGPAVSVRVVPAAPPPKGVPWWLLLLGALVVISGAVAAFVLLRDGETPPAPQECASGRTRCGEQCVELGADERNCGACGNTCEVDFECQQGQCVRTGCPEGQTLCGDRCVDTRTDERNCGLCGRSCATNQTCQDGVCRCTAGLSLCGGTCVNLQTSDANCGRCGTRCATNADCRDGRCVPRSGCPITGQILCPCTGTCLSPALCTKRCQQDVQPF